MAITTVRAAFTLRADNIGTGATVSSGANFTAGSDVVVGYGLFASTPSGYISAVTVNGVAAVQIGGENAGNLPSGNGSSGIWLAKNVPGGGPNVVFTITGSAAGNYIYGGGLEATYISATAVATLTTADASGQTTPTFNITSPSAQIGALVAFANHCGNQGYTTAGTGQTMWFNSSTDTSGEEAAGVYKFATASGDQSITLDKITSANGNYTMVVLAEGTGPGQAASPSRKGRITHPGKRGPLLLTHFRRGFRPNTAASSVTLALTGVVGTAAVGTVVSTRTVATTGNAATSAPGTLVPASSVATTGNAATGAVGTAVAATSVPVTGSAATGAVGTLGAQSGAPVGSRRRSMGTSPRVTPYNLRKFYKTARNSFVVASPDVTLALTGVAATSAAGNALSTRTVPMTGSVGTAAVGTLVPANAQPVTGNATASAVGTLAPASVVALTGNVATGAAGSVSASGAGTATLTGVSAPASPGTLAPTNSIATTGVAGSGAAGTVGVSRTVALTGNAASGVVGSVASGNDIIVAITGVAATSAAGSVKAAMTRGLTGSAATGSAGSLTPSGTGVFEPGNELVWRVPQRSRVWHLGS